MKVVLIAMVLLSSLFSTCQVMSEEEIDEGELNVWREDVPSLYEGRYSFGFSEDETTLRVFVDGDTVWAQILFYSWNQASTNWVLEFKNLHHVRVEKDKFYSDETNGEFIYYKSEKCLKIDKPWSIGIVDNKYELGKKQGAAKLKLQGEYPQASTSILEEKELLKYDKPTLQIMRNEIYARYSHTFKKGGKMEAYFTKKDWYQAQHKDATKFLSEVEKKNIKLIQALEAKK